MGWPTAGRLLVAGGLGEYAVVPWVGHVELPTNCTAGTGVPELDTEALGPPPLPQAASAIAIVAASASVLRALITLSLYQGPVAVPVRPA